jgi:hypothetical protein
MQLTKSFGKEVDEQKKRGKHEENMENFNLEARNWIPKLILSSNQHSGSMGE